jgi:hypothetical protein
MVGEAEVGHDAISFLLMRRARTRRGVISPEPTWERISQKSYFLSIDDIILIFCRFKELHFYGKAKKAIW